MKTLDTKTASESLATGKKRLLVNTAANVFTVVTQSLITFLLAPYLIRELGVAAYGMIALSNTIPAYIQLFTKSISNSVFRFVAVDHNDGEANSANEYLSTAFWSLIMINVPLLVAAIFISCSFSRLFEVPAGLEFQSNLLAFCMFLACIVGTSSSILKVPYLLTHDFLLQNLLLVIARILGVTILLFCFWIWGASLIFVGLYHLSFQVFVISLLLVFRSRIKTTVKFSGWKFFRKEKLTSLLKFGRWVFVNDLAVLLYLAIGIVVINKILGADATGRFGPVMLLNSLLIMIGGALGTALMPLFFSLISYKNPALLNTRFLQAVRILGFTSGFVVLVLAGLSRQILELWLDDSFTNLWPLVWMTAFSTWLGGVCFIPSNQIYRAIDRVSAIAVWNLIFGVIHIATTIILMSWYDLGLWAFGVSYTINFGVRGVILNSYFTTQYMNHPIDKLPRIIGKLALIVLLLAFGLFWIASQCLVNWTNLFGLIFVAGFIYLSSAFFAFSKDDLSMLMNIVLRKRLVQTSGNFPE